MTDPTFFGPSRYGTVIDDIWIVQSKHGPFDATRFHREADAADKRQPPTQHSFDHWDGVRAGLHSSTPAGLDGFDKSMDFLLGGLKMRGHSDGSLGSGLHAMLATRGLGGVMWEPTAHSTEHTKMRSMGQCDSGGPHT